MIVSQFQERRYFVGRLDEGQDIIGGIKTVCTENRISCGWIQAVAVLARPEIGAFDGSRRLVDTVVFCPQLCGNVSLLGSNLDIRVYASFNVPGSSGTEEVAGRVLAGEVRMCEFFLMALDDVTFVRDEASTFAHWVQLQTPEDLRARAHQVPQAIQPMTRPPQEPLFRSSESDDTDELVLMEIQPGDYLDHPRFGLCRVLCPPKEDHVTVRLGSGKNVDLHTGVLRILPCRESGGKKIFPVELRRRT